MLINRNTKLIKLLHSWERFKLEWNNSRFFLDKDVYPLMSDVSVNVIGWTQSPLLILEEIYTSNTLQEQHAFLTDL